MLSEPFFYEEAQATGLPAMAYAHMGSGHPHTNMITRNAQEKAKARDIIRQFCRRAVAVGGGVAGEHGLGKLHRDLLAVQHPPPVIAAMRRWKETYDPNGLLGRGNIF